MKKCVRSEARVGLQGLYGFAYVWIGLHFSSSEHIGEFS